MAFADDVAVLLPDDTHEVLRGAAVPNVDGLKAGFSRMAHILSESECKNAASKPCWLSGGMPRCTRRARYVPRGKRIPRQLKAATRSGATAPDPGRFTYTEERAGLDGVAYYFLLADALKVMGGAVDVVSTLGKLYRTILTKASVKQGASKSSRGLEAGVP